LCKVGPSAQKWADQLFSRLRREHLEQASPRLFRARLDWKKIVWRWRCSRRCMYNKATRPGAPARPPAHRLSGEAAAETKASPFVMTCVFLLVLETV
jgi:hypothetical protein